MPISTVGHFTTHNHHFTLENDPNLEALRAAAEALRSAEENPESSVIHFHDESTPEVPISCTFNNHEIRNVGSVNVIQYTPEEDPPIDE